MKGKQIFLNVEAIYILDKIRCNDKGQPIMSYSQAVKKLRDERGKEITYIEELESTILALKKKAKK